jgi:hypothetical protein
MYDHLKKDFEHQNVMSELECQQIHNVVRLNYHWEFQMLNDHMGQLTTDNLLLFPLIDDIVNVFHLMKIWVHHVFVDNDNHVEVLISHKQF